MALKLGVFQRFSGVRGGFAQSDRENADVAAFSWLLAVVQS